MTSLCSSCKHLEIWPGVFQGRYVCSERKGNAKAFGKYGRGVSKGLPQVIRCDEFETGKHYSMMVNIDAARSES